MKISELGDNFTIITHKIVVERCIYHPKIRLTIILIVPFLPQIFRCRVVRDSMGNPSPLQIVLLALQLEMSGRRVQDMSGH